MRPARPILPALMLAPTLAVTLALTLAIAFAVPATAQQVQDCDARASARNLAEPWDASTRTFASGAIRLAMIDMIEPAGAPFYLLVLSPPYDEIGDRQCRLIEGPGNMGFYSMDLETAEASYDPALGLTVRVPIRLYGQGDIPRETMLDVLINQATGDISARVAG